MEESVGMLKNIQSVVSVGVAYGQGVSIEYVNALSIYMQNNFLYYEIVVVINPVDASRDVVDGLSCVKNVHVIVLNIDVYEDSMRLVVFENAIGDFVVLIDPKDARIESVGILVARALESGVESIRMSCVDSRSTIYSIASKVFFKLISLISGYKIDSDLSYTGCYSRVLVDSVNTCSGGISSLRVLLASVGFGAATMHGACNPTRRMVEFVRKICSCVDVIGSVPQRLLKFVSLLALVTSMANIIYIFYIFGVWCFFSNVQPGWATTSLVQSAHNFVLFLIIFIFSSVSSAQICCNDKKKICVARSKSRSDFIENFNATNVEKA